MNKIWPTVALLMLTTGAACAEESVVTSTPTPSVALTGETTTQVIPDAMTTAPAGGVFVTLSRSALPLTTLTGSVQRVDAERFDVFGARNAGDAISREVGLQFFPTGGLYSMRQARVRGAPVNQTLVLLDGRPIGGAAFSSGQDLSEIPTEQIDHIEVVRGGLSALYGPNAMAGVVNVISKRANYQGLPISHVNFEGRSQNAQTTRLDFGSRWGRADYIFFGDTARETGFLRNSDARNYNIGGNLGLSMGKAGKWIFDVGSFHSGTGVPEDLERRTTQSDYLRSSYILPLPEEMLATFRFYGSKREVSLEDPGILHTARTEESKGGELQLELPLGFLVGGQFTHDRLDSEDAVSPVNNILGSTENWGLFVQSSFRYRRISWVIGARHDHDSRGYESNNPRVQTMVDVAPWLRLSGSAARSFRVPTLDESMDNATLRPEKGWTYDGGFEVHEGSVSLQATYFHVNLTNLIQTTPSSVINIGEARRQGAEVSIRQAFHLRLKHQANYTYLKNEGRDLYLSGQTNVVPAFTPLGLSPKHTVNYTITYLPHRLFSVDNSVRYLSGYFDGDGESGGKLGDTVLWDIRLSFYVRQAQIYLGLTDLLDKRYENRAGIALAGRAMFAGIRVKLWG